MKYLINLKKMTVHADSPVRYELITSNRSIVMNELIGKKISFKWDGDIECISCGKKTNKSFAQGYCYPCFMTVPETAPCILRPELCEAHFGISRNMEWSGKNCLSEHIVYIALSSGIKVGVTRAGQIPTRWIDQGASEAIIFCRVPNRNTAGVIEVKMKNYFSDKTSWQKMLKNEIQQNVNLIDEKNKAINYSDDFIKQFISSENEIYKFEYPVDKYPEKVKSINLDKEPDFEKTFIGIKGQYLIFDDDTVINIRKYGGYKIELSC